MRQRRGLRYHEADRRRGQRLRLGAAKGRVLANLQAIRSKHVIDLAEYEALLTAQERIRHDIRPPRRASREQLLCAMHRDWLERPSTLGQVSTVRVRTAEGKLLLAAGLSGG